jgi:hypothetical protein
MDLANPNIDVASHSIDSNSRMFNLFYQLNSMETIAKAENPVQDEKQKEKVVEIGTDNNYCSTLVDENKAKKNKLIHSSVRMFIDRHNQSMLEDSSTNIESDSSKCKPSKQKIEMINSLLNSILHTYNEHCFDDPINILPQIHFDCSHVDCSNKRKLMFEDVKLPNGFHLALDGCYIVETNLSLINKKTKLKSERIQQPGNIVKNLVQKYNDEQLQLINQSSSSPIGIVHLSCNDLNCIAIRKNLCKFVNLAPGYTFDTTYSDIILINTAMKELKYIEKEIKVENQISPILVKNEHLKTWLNSWVHCGSFPGAILSVNDKNGDFLERFLSIKFFNKFNNRKYTFSSFA